VAIHARLGRRHAGKGRVLDGGVTVTTVDAIVGDVVLVAERHRLFHRLTNVGDLRRADIQLEHAEQDTDAHESAKKR
jgi:hypothetical protein